MKNLNNKIIYILHFNRINKSDFLLAGGKGASLGEMTQAKIPVPKGFVILAPAFDEFLLKMNLNTKIQKELKTINYDNSDSLAKVSLNIRTLIYNTKFPQNLKEQILIEFKKLKTKYVAVRSSATSEDSSTASWAGELESFLNITQKNLISKIKKCWSSLFTPQALVYRKKQKLLKSKISVAVVIQKMVQSEISGVSFTVHPVTKNKNQMIIEAGYGLGEAIVSGSITPDSYIIDKRDFSIIDIILGRQKKKLIKDSMSGKNKWVKLSVKNREKQVLTKVQIKKLAKICVNIEKHYKFPCDIEWAFAKGKFYIIQSRPITTL